MKLRDLRSALLGSLFLLALSAQTSRASFPEFGTAEVLGFEHQEDWFLVEGAGFLAQSSDVTSGYAALYVGGSGWRRIESVALSNIGASSNAVRLDVRLDASAEAWESFGLALEIPSRGLWWQELAAVSLADLPAGEYRTISLPLPEAVREVVNGNYEDLRLFISANTQAPITIDNLSFAALSSPTPSSSERPVDSSITSGAPAPGACSSDALQLIDLYADFRDIWAGRERADEGKRAEPQQDVTLVFDAPVERELVSASFVPDFPGETCSRTPIPALAVPAAEAWLQHDGLAGQSYPGAFSAFVRDSVSGPTDAHGPVAAGHDVTLGSFSINLNAHQPFGLVSGGQVQLTSGALYGNVSYGRVSEIPSTVSIAQGAASQQSVIDFDVAFAQLSALSEFLSNDPPNGSANVEWGTLKLSGAHPELNVFRVAAAALNSAHTIEVAVPTGAGALINVTGGDVTLRDKGISLRGASNSLLLWNLTQARWLGMSGLRLPGSVLAPHADVFFDSGDLVGTLVAQSLTGAGTLHYAPLDAKRLLGGGSHSTVIVRPTRPLGRDCKYTFTLTPGQPFTRDGECLAEPGVRVEFRVAAQRKAPASRELVDTIVDPRALTLRRFAAKPGINTPVEEVFSRYASVIGVAPEDLLQEGPTTQSSLRPEHERGFYRQYYAGHPVEGFGYFVESEAGIFRSAIGKVLPIAADTRSSISEQAARQAALGYLAALPRKASTADVAAHGQLALHPLARDPEPKAFALRWQFEVVDHGALGPRAIRVDAKTGAVTDVDQARDEALDGTYVGQVSGTLETSTHGKQTISTAHYDLSGGPEAVLSSGPVVEPGSVQSLLLKDFDESGFVTEYVFDPNFDGTWSEPVARETANAFWSLVNAQAFAGTLGFRFQERSWKSIDGAGMARIELLYDDEDLLPSCPAVAGKTNAYFMPAGTTDPLGVARILMVAGSEGAPLDPGLMAHEFGHGVLHNLRALSGLQDLWQSKEAGSINEGVADLYGAAAVRRQMPGDEGWACTGLNGECKRSISRPNDTKNPAYYRGLFYEDYGALPTEQCGNACSQSAPNNGNCGRHLNSTVVSHWGYLLSLGSDGPVPQACGMVVRPLDADPGVALQKTLNIVLHAAGEYLDKYATFTDLRDATATVAGKLYDEATVEQVLNAWAAVGVGSGANPKDVTPADGATDVDPWSTKFRVRLREGEKWRLRYSTDADFAHDVHEAPMLRSGEDVYAAITLEPNTRYYWQAGPGSAGADWQRCAVISSSFKTMEKRVELKEPTQLVDGVLQTDFLGEVQWYEEEMHRISVSTSERANGCAAPDVTAYTGGIALGNSYDLRYDEPYVEIIDEVEGKPIDSATTYYVHVQPTYGDSEGACSTFRVRRRRLESFQMLHPMRGPGRAGVTVAFTNEDPTIPSLVLDRGFEFEKSDGAVAYEVVARAIAPDGGDDVLYRITRPVGHCGLQESTDLHPLTQKPWMSWRFDCDGEAVANEPKLAEWINWEVYWDVVAISAEGLQRSAWDFGDIRGPFSVTNSFMYPTYDHVPPMVSSTMTGRPYLEFGGELVGELELLGLPAVHYDNTSSSAVLDRTNREHSWCIFEPPPLIAGYDVWLAEDSQLAESHELRVTSVTKWPHCFKKQLTPKAHGQSTTLRMLVRPWTYHALSGKGFTHKQTYITGTATWQECGATGQACCGAEGTCGGSNVCIDAKCAHCGRATEPCCGTTCEAGSTCKSGKCELTCQSLSAPSPAGPRDSVHDKVYDCGSAYSYSPWPYAPQGTNISWTSVPGATSYELKLRAFYMGDEETRTVSGTTFNLKGDPFMDKVIDNFRGLVCFKVRAVNACGTSDWSSEGSTFYTISYDNPQPNP